MSLAIRTQIDSSLVASVATVQAFLHTGASAASIFLNPSRAVQESEPKPYVIICTDAERVKKTSLYRDAKFMAEISVWGIADDNVSLYPLLVDYMFQINAALLPIGSLIRKSGLITGIEETGIGMDTYFFETGLGAGISQYEISYRTVYGDPYTLNP